MILVILLSLGLFLGNWQMDRAEQKRSINALFERHAAAEALSLRGDEMDKEDMLFRQVHVHGTYDLKQQVLVENQKYNGVPGYQVMTPLRIKGSQMHVLVNRGWVKQGDDRRFIPELPGPTQTQFLSGRVGNAPSVGMKLGAPGERGKVWPKRLVYIDIDWIAREAGYPLLPYVIYLPEGAADGLLRGKPSLHMHTAMSPEKHMSYAVQWFSLAGLALLMYIILSLRKSGSGPGSGVNHSE